MTANPCVKWRDNSLWYLNVMRGFLLHATEGATCTSLFGDFVLSELRIVVTKQAIEALSFTASAKITSKRIEVESFTLGSMGPPKSCHSKSISRALETNAVISDSMVVNWLVVNCFTEVGIF